ncbi:hypothetical protein [Rhabdochlamydiaceae symbiont of Dictyostelium giganteum]|uniref:hypothetical protein n=1 Tax=Rhabdochlamydiaceae symbiont of Dictyostelium giganteum TaxID=3342349 RepID=UPI00384EF888
MSKNKKATTKDELFLLKLHELSLEKGSEFEEIGRFVIGRAIGQNDKGVNAISKHLAQANFIKKGSEDSFFLTPHGLSLVELLLKERA